MPGIEDVQPKQLSTLGQPLVGQVEPASTPEAVQQMLNAFRSGYITTKDIMERNDALTSAKQRAELQLAKETVSPESVAARSEVQRLASEKALMERETGLSKDFVGAYLRYNLPLKKADGKPDYSGMAEVGQKYADLERKLKFAEMGLKGEPRTILDAKGHPRQVVLNAFGEDITMVPGKTNPLLVKYQKMAQDARAFLLQNDNEPSVAEGKAAPIIDVSPKTVTDAGPSGPISVVGGAPTVEVLPRINDASPSPAYAVVGGTLPTPVAAPAVVEVAPKAAVVKPDLDLYTPGEGVAVPGETKPDDILKDARSAELYKNWAEKSPAIAAFRATAKAYESLPEGSVTTQNDVALANAAMQIAAPGSTAGGRGMQEYQVQQIDKSIPLIEQLLDIKDIVLKNDKFPKGVRDRIIAVTEQKAQALEGMARDVVKGTADRITSTGHDPAEYLWGPEKRLIETSGPTGAGSPGPGVPRGKPITLSSGKTVVLW